MPVQTTDPTQTMTIDEKIQPNVAEPLATFDITIAVTPGHDMVINHGDGSQELSTGAEMLAVVAKETELGRNVPLAEVQAAVDPETTHRSVPDPEVNGTDQATLAAVVAPADAPEVPDEPEAPAETPEQTPVSETVTEPDVAPEKPAQDPVPQTSPETSVAPTPEDVEGL